MWPFKRKSKEKLAVEELTEFTDQLMEYAGPIIDANDDRRLAFFVFLFGSATGLGIKMGLAPPQVHAVAVTLYMKSESLQLPAEDAAMLAQFGIGATDKSSDWNFAIHAGADEFLDWRSGSENFKPRRLRKVFKMAPPAPV